MVTNYDCVVAGGGPAGAFTACELARAGLDVVMVDPETSRPRLEGLGERVVQLLRARGLEQPLAAASEPMARSVAWADLASTPNGERLVRRDLFDTALRQAARHAGARHRTARIARILSSDPKEGAQLRLSTGETVAARVMVDARGRQARSAQRLMGPKTLAISGFLPEGGDQAGTFVASTPDGWLWSAEAPGFGRCVQICIDMEDLEGTGAAALERRMARFLNQPAVRERFRDRDFFRDRGFDATFTARSAGLVLSAPELCLPVIPVGDAAVAIDPLSGHGLFWALSSALAAVPCVLSVLETPDRGRDLARRFHRGRVVDTFWRQARIGRDFYRLEQGLTQASFWARRATWPDDRPAHRREDGVSLSCRVVVENNRLVEREVLTTPLDPDGVAFVAGIPISALTEFIGSEARRASVPATPSAALRTALDWMESRGLFRHASQHSEVHQPPQQATRMRDRA